MVDCLPPVPSPAAARRRVREAAGRTLPWRFQLSRIYERSVYLVVFGGIAVQMVRTAIDGGSGSGSAHVDLTDRTGVGLVLTVLAFSVLLKALLAVGPLSVSAASASWFLSSPLDRRRALLSGFFVALLSASVAGLLWPGFLVLLTGFAVRISGELVLIHGAVAVACAGLAIDIQAGRRRVAEAWQSMLSGIIGMNALLLAVDMGVGGRLLGSLSLGAVVDQLTPAALLLAPAAALVFSIAAIIKLGGLTRSSLSSGRAIAVGLTLSVTSFEFGLLGSIVTERRATRIGHVPSSHLGRRSWLLSIVGADLVRLRRAPGKLLVVACLLLVPPLFGSGVSGPAADFVPAVFTLTAFLTADRLAGTQRIALRSTGVRRLLGISPRRLSAALAVVPFVGTTVWCCLAGALTAGISTANVAVAAIGSVMVVYRISTRPPLSYDDTSFIDFGALGPAPLGLLKQLSRGPTLLVILMLVQVLLL